MYEFKRMRERGAALTLGEPARYQIKIQGRLDEGWADHFSGMKLSSAEGSAVTTLEGVVADQAALFGLLLQLRDLGLPLLSVCWLESG